jgi:hypothetical protein
MRVEMRDAWRPRAQPGGTEAPLKLRLEIVDGPESGRSLELDGAGSLLVGRSPEARLCLDPAADPRISRAHCLIELRPPRLTVVDLDSANGTFVNGRRIRKQTLADGDEIRAGRTRIAVHLLPATQSSSGPGVHRPAGEGKRPDPPDQAASAPHREHPLACLECGLDLTAPALSDGLGDSPSDAAYLCSACAAAEQAPELTGQRLGEFTLLQPHGHGGMGVVFRAVHEPTRRVCAVKRLHGSVADDERARRTFEREIDVQGAVRHPNLARVLGRGEAAGHFFVAMEFLAGGDAGQLVSRTFSGPLPPALACHLILQVLAGLEALHAAGFVHRDLKPANFLLSRHHTDPASVTKITDYGLAKSYADAGQSIYDYTLAGEAGGSLLFMPPEQILNFRFVTPAADVYAVGVSLYYLLTARYTIDVPKRAATPPGSQRRNPLDLILEASPVKAQLRNPRLPDDLAAVVDRAVQKEQAARFASAAALRLALLSLAAAVTAE